MKLTDESWISYQQGKGNEEYQKYMEDLTEEREEVLRIWNNLKYTLFLQDELVAVVHVNSKLNIQADLIPLLSFHGLKRLMTMT